MAIDFPSGPVNGQTFTSGTKQWTYSSADSTWVLSSVSADSGTLTSKGDILTRSTSALARVGVGSDGQVLTANSGVTEGLSWVDPPVNRNVVINGAMQVAQRGTSTTGINANGYYTADRWQVSVGFSPGAYTQSIEVDAPTGSGFRNSLKMLCTTADTPLSAGDVVRIQQFVEGQNAQQFLKGSSNAKQFALTFWVKSNVTGTYIAQLRDDDNVRQVSASYSISASATWEKKTIIFPADTTGVFDNDNARSLTLAFYLSAGSDYTSGTLRTTWASTTTADLAVGQTNLAAATNNYWQVTGVQLEPGPVATPFEFEPYDVTLAKCQRYYYLHVSGTGKAIGSAANFSATTAVGVIHYPVTMRTDPTLSATSGTDYYAFARNSGDDLFNSLTLERTGTNCTAWGNTAQISGTAGHGGYAYTNNASASIAFAAEL